MILLDEDEVKNATGWNYLSGDELILLRQSNEAQAKKILIKLQAIYNIADLGTSDKKMGEFIQSLMGEVK